MNSIEMVEATLQMLKRNGFRPTDIEASNGTIKIAGLEPLADEMTEESEEAAESRARTAFVRENLELLGIK